MIHGIGGSLYGLVPLAYALRHDFSLILIDLPCHGRSENISWRSYEELSHWSHDLVDTLEQESVPIQCIIAHSWGATLVTQELCARKSVIFINPQLRVARFTQAYQKVISLIPQLTARLYYTSFLSRLREKAVRFDYSQDANKIIDWLESKPLSRPDQIRAQINLGAIRPSADELIRFKPYMVIVGVDDVMRMRDLQEGFAESIIKELPGGHLLPIETPERVAELVSNLEQLA